MVREYLRLIRVKHWIKNIFVFGPLIFSLNFLDVPLVVKSLIAFFSFCFASSFVYIINDIIDKEKDSKHPLKKDRPIASGKISIQSAFYLSFILIVIAAMLSYKVNFFTFLIILGYIILNMIYSTILKHQVILDVMIIAFGFLLRVVAGGVALKVPLSPWIFLTTLFVSLFIGFAKRRKEIMELNSGKKHRPVLDSYNIELLNYLIIISLTLTIITYSLYAADTETLRKLGTDKVIYSVPLVIYGVFRYLFLIYKKHLGGDPADIVLKDKNILVTVILWGAFIIGLLYFENFVR